MWFWDRSQDFRDIFWNEHKIVHGCSWNNFDSKVDQGQRQSTLLPHTNDNVKLHIFGWHTSDHLFTLHGLVANARTLAHSTREGLGELLSDKNIECRCAYTNNDFYEKTSENSRNNIYLWCVILRYTTKPQRYVLGWKWNVALLLMEGLSLTGW